jgi:hypothetical protein
MTRRSRIGEIDSNALEDRIMSLLVKNKQDHRAKHRIRILATLFSLTVTCIGVSSFSTQVVNAADPQVNAQQFAGTWQAKFKGKVFQTIKLENSGGKFTGTISHADITVDPKTGELTDVNVSDGSAPIVEAKLKNGILLITGQDEIQFSMKLTRANEAELQIVIPADEADQVPAPKPWKLERVKG